MKQVTSAGFYLKQGCRERISGTGIGQAGVWTGQAKLREQIQFSSWRGGHGERLWLSTLVETMEQVGQPARRAEPCDAKVLKALRAQFALPAQPRFPSRFGLRN